MAQKRFFDNPPLQKFNNVAIPLTDLNDDHDYAANVEELQKLVFQGGALADY